MDQDLIAYLDQRFGETSRQLESVRTDLSTFREEVNRRFEGVDGEIRHTRVLVEQLRHEVHIVAEGVMGLSDRLAANQSETLLKFDEVRASMVPYYQDLNRRVLNLEGRAERQTRDIIEVIKEKFGKAQ